jgi:hypothetical protein
MDRFFRRLGRFRRKHEFPQDPATVKAKQRELDSVATPPDTTSPREKSQRHGKVTADKWNQ